MTYYARPHQVEADGSIAYQSDDDAFNERRVKARLEAAWKCTLNRYPRLHVIDYWAERDERVIGHVEVKARTHTAATHDTVYLNLRKYMNLYTLEAATGVPSTFVVAFSCGTIKWIRVTDIAGHELKPAGMVKDRGVNLRSDREPIVLVRVADMTTLEEK